MVGSMRGTGTIIKQTLEAWWIKAYGGCGCNDLAAEMNQVGPQVVLRDIESYTTKMEASIATWRAERLITRMLPQPPRETVYALIEWAANKSIEESQPTTAL